MYLLICLHAVYSPFSGLRLKTFLCPNRFSQSFSYLINEFISAFEHNSRNLNSPYTAVNLPMTRICLQFLHHFSRKSMISKPSRYFPFLEMFIYCVLSVDFFLFFFYCQNHLLFVGLFLRFRICFEFSEDYRKLMWLTRWPLKRDMLARRKINIQPLEQTMFWPSHDNGQQLKARGFNSNHNSNNKDH